MKTQKLQNRLSLARAEKNISQQTLAKAVSVSRQTINAIENRRYEPSCFLAIKLAMYFMKKVEVLFWIE